MRVLFERCKSAQPAWICGGLLAALYVAGLAAWIYFMGAGAVALDFHDWADITIPRLRFVQSSLLAHELPLHVARSNALHGVTERFLSIPDVITSPQSLLLMVLPINTFVVVDVLINYTIGFVALLMLRRYFDWSLLAFAFAFLLILFNGHVLAHYSVGHFTWGPYFLFPLVALLLFKFLDGDNSWRLVAAFAATLFYMSLAGGYHHVTWILLLLVLLLPFCWRRSGWIVAAAVAACLLSAVRLLPPGLELESFQRAGFVTDVHGYPSLMHLVESLVYLRREHGIRFREIPANMLLFDERFWEYNLYIGVVGAIAMGWGAWQWLRQPRYRELAVPLGVLLALSMGSVYRLPRFSGIPLLLGERATSRMAGLVLVFLVIVAATEIDRWLRGVVSASRRTLVLIALAFLSLDIAASIRLQRVAVSSGTFGSAAFNPSNVAHPVDPLYMSTIAVGLGITTVTAVALMFLVWRERRAPEAIPG